MTKDQQDRIVTSLTGASSDDWHDFFEFLRQYQYKKISSAVCGEQLLVIQAQVKSYDFLENTFLGIVKDKKIGLTNSQK